MSPWIPLCRPGYTYVALDTLMSPWIHLCRPGNTYVALDTPVSPLLHLCCPGPTYVTLDTLLPTWIQFCRPGYTQVAGGYTYVALDTIISPWRHICVSCVVQPPLPCLSEMSVYSTLLHTALTAKVLNLLKKTLCTNFFVPFIMLTNINKNFFR